MSFGSISRTTRCIWFHVEVVFVWRCISVSLPSICLTIASVARPPHRSPASDRFSMRPRPFSPVGLGTVARCVLMKNKAVLFLGVIVIVEQMLYTCV